MFQQILISKENKTNKENTAGSDVAQESEERTYN